jgi:hypothetical protein
MVTVGRIPPSSASSAAVIVTLGELRLDLCPDLADDHRERALAEHVHLQLFDRNRCTSPVFRRTRTDVSLSG